MNLRVTGLLGRWVADLRDSKRAAPGNAGAPTTGFRVERDDLVAPCTREDIEALEQAVDPMGAAPTVPFGHLNPAWQRFVRTLRADDELWRFDAQRMAIDGAAEIRCGYVVVRDGRPRQAMVASVRSLPPTPTPPTPPIDRSSPRRGAETAMTRSEGAVTVE